ncbi:MAG: hypothetical protein ACREX4_24975 [Gammaproteobacteria bacterium]
MATTTKSKSGRPPKFRGPRRPITVTLPEGTLARLASIDPDRARAIVKATDTIMPLDAEPHKQVELVEVAPGLGIIIVGPSRLLQKIKWLRLVEVAPMRFLLTIPLGTSVDSIEVAITDLLEDAKSYDDWEHSILSQLRDLIQRLRRRGQLSKAEMLFIDTRAMGARTDAEPDPPTRSTA